MINDAGDFVFRLISPIVARDRQLLPPYHVLLTTEPNTETRA